MLADVRKVLQDTQTAGRQLPEHAGSRGKTYRRLDSPQHGVPVRDDALVRVDFEHARVGRAHLAGQASAAGDGLGGRRRGGRGAIGGLREQRLDVVRLLLATLEVGDELETLDERQVRDNVIAESLGGRDVVGDRGVAL